MYQRLITTALFSLILVGCANQETTQEIEVTEKTQKAEQVEMSIEEQYLRDKAATIEKSINKPRDEAKNYVYIGMTKEQVLSTNWGAPKDINRTITANHTSEQWVYQYGSYLYFEDGILVAIQN